MKFCSNCGTRLRFKQVKISDTSMPALACDRCGFYIEVKSSIAKPETSEGEGEIKVVGEEAGKLKTMPTTTVECIKCGHTTAFWWLVQTRGGDEPTTQFFRCERCGHTWRQYA